MPTALTVQTDMSNFTTTQASSTGNTFDNSTGQVYLHVVNFSSSDSRTVTIAEQRTCNFGHATQDETFTVEADSTRILGPFDILRFNNSSREVTVTYSTAFGVEVAAVRG